MTETQSIPRLLPTLTETNTPFWTRGRQNELVILRHRETGAWFHPPELAESGDNGGDNNIVPEVVSGKGTVMTFTVNHHPYNPEVPVPYVIAVVELTEDASIRLPTNIVGCEPDEVYIGMPVRVLFEQREDVAIPLFKPDNFEPDDDAPQGLGTQHD